MQITFEEHDENLMDGIFFSSRIRLTEVGGGILLREVPRKDLD